MPHRSNRLASLVFASHVAAAAAALAQVPLRWTADLARPAAADWTVWQGETVSLEPTFVSYGQPAPPLSAALYWQTNGMGAAWWQLPAQVDTGAPGRVRCVFSPTNDAGAGSYAYFIRGEGAGGSSWRAFGTLTMLSSPGFTPAATPPPAVYPELAAELAPLVAGLLPPPSADLTPATNYTDAAVAALGAADTNLQAQVNALTGSLYSASSAGTALRLVSVDSNWWVGVDAGTATLWRVTSTNEGWTSRIPEQGRADPVAGLTFPVESVFEAGDMGVWYLLIEFAGSGRYDISLMTGAGEWFGADVLPVSPIQLDPAGNGANQPAYLEYSGTRSTNLWDQLATSTDISNVLTATAAATNAVVQTYLMGTNAWLIVSNDVLRIQQLCPTNAAVTNLLWQSGEAFPATATQSLWQAVLQLAEGQAALAPKAWGQYAPDGGANPDPAYMTWLNAPATVFASGCSWSSSGTYAVLTMTGQVAFAAGSSGAFRIGPDSTNWFGYATGGSVLVGAVPDSITVTDGGETNGYAEIVYPYEGGDFPTVWFAPSLAADFTDLPSALWTDNLDGTAVVTVPATTPSGFWKATTATSFSSVFESAMPARFSGGVFGATNTAPVVYDSTITITSGGHTYLVPAQLAE